MLAEPPTCPPPCDIWFPHLHASALLRTRCANTTFCAFLHDISPQMPPHLFDSAQVSLVPQSIIKHLDALEHSTQADASGATRYARLGHSMGTAWPQHGAHLGAQYRAQHGQSMGVRGRQENINHPVISYTCTTHMHYPCAPSMRTTNYAPPPMQSHLSAKGKHGHQVAVVWIGSSGVLGLGILAQPMCCNPMHHCLCPPLPKFHPGARRCSKE